MAERYRASDLLECASLLFQRAGLDAPIAAVVAEILVEADLLGYATHGLQFTPAYIAGIETGRTATSGEPVIINDHGGTLLLDAAGLPGQWVVVKALEMAFARLDTHPVVCMVIRGSENISCLATYVKRAALQGYMAILTTSSPGNAAVAPFGGRVAQYSTNPMAFGIPTDGNPILIDTSMSSTTNRLLEKTRRTGGRLPGQWLIDNKGQRSDDPEDFFADPPGAIAPAGGADLGHKGFAFAILVEALTSGLAGVGRADGDDAKGSNIFLQVIDPAAFGGPDAFKRETGYFAALCRDTPPLSPDSPVRMPGDRAFDLYERQQRDGVDLHPEIMARIRPLLEKYQITAPTQIS
ncbi:MAG: Ldh family oxidoreductase [Alphaproteobacteria bacterium]|nr:Ldh family oxidoreductase [Alphaproteobacteria bacterium]